MVLGAVLVGAAVAASVCTEPVVSLLGEDLSGHSVGVSVPVTVFNLVMYGVATLVPPLLVAVGIALPLVGIYQYREAMLTPRRRGTTQAGAMPVTRATLLGWAEVVVLLVVAVAGIVALNPREKEDAGMAEPHLIYVEPPFHYGAPE
ncbi:hypothetical protein PSMK_29210 [Phycisphaera mikurensis NBRC 102666]|uniref:Uncharacterized protein n=2 Tax=Phycisphaera TaxID=666508 RepID=I0IIJ2_PHYMF|nr:hypothetical protein PSMK_29210 [Phycisphaera mikurensis NBRC 102666]